MNGWTIKLGDHLIDGKIGWMDDGWIDKWMDDLEKCISRLDDGWTDYWMNEMDKLQRFKNFSWSWLEGWKDR